MIFIYLTSDWTYSSNCLSCGEVYSSKNMKTASFHRKLLAAFLWVCVPVCYIFASCKSVLVSVSGSGTEQCNVQARLLIDIVLWEYCCTVTDFLLSCSGALCVAHQTIEQALMDKTTIHSHFTKTTIWSINIENLYIRLLKLSWILFIYYDKCAACVWFRRIMPYWPHMLSPIVAALAINALQCAVRCAASATARNKSI